MKRLTLLAALVTLLFPVCAAAQSSAFGVTIGSGESLDDGVDFEFGDTVVQLYYETDFGGGTSFRFQYGTFDVEPDPDDTGNTLPDSKMQYVNLITQYEFDEIYGQSAIFGGLGLYQNEIDGLDDQKDWGVVLGVNGAFPVSRNFALTAEIAYHWADFDENLSVIIVSGGFKVRF